MENVLFECPDRSGMVADELLVVSNDIGIAVSSKRTPHDCVQLRPSDVDGLIEALQKWRALNPVSNLGR